MSTGIVRWQGPCPAVAARRSSCQLQWCRAAGRCGSRRPHPATSRHAAVKAALRPTTWVHYGDYINAYVVPHIGATPLQELTPLRLNLLYTHLLEHSRVKRQGGLSPKTVQN